MAAVLTKPERETLKAIWRLTASGTAAARTGDLATSLRVSPGTATATVKRLGELGLVCHEPYRGVELTPDGTRHAMAVIRRHRIVERFLSDVLSYDWVEADRLAPTFEHQLPQEVEDRLYEVLDRPTTCPHGFPIPGEEVDSLPALPPLWELAVGVPAVVALPGSIDPEVARFLDGLGLRPGAEVVVVERHPFDGPLVVAIGGARQVLGEKLARQILAAPSGAPPAPVPRTDGAPAPTSERKAARR